MKCYVQGCNAEIAFKCKCSQAGVHLCANHLGTHILVPSSTPHNYAACVKIIDESKKKKVIVGLLDIVSQAEALEKRTILKASNTIKTIQNCLSRFIKELRGFKEKVVVEINSIKNASTVLETNLDYLK